MTSAPNGCCAFSIELTAAGCPVSRSSSVATTVVVPRSNAIACRRALVSPGSTSSRTSSHEHRGDLPVRCAQRPAERRAAGRSARAARRRPSRRARARGRRSGPRASARSARDSASARPAAGSRAGRRRRAPPSAASAAAAPRRRGPPRRARGRRAASRRFSSSAENARGSTARRHACPTRRAPCTSCTCRDRRRSSRSRRRSSSRVEERSSPRGRATSLTWPSACSKRAGRAPAAPRLARAGVALTPRAAASAR